MKKGSKSRKPPLVGHGIRAALLSWYGTKKPVLQFAAKFAGLVLCFTLVSLTPAFQSLLAWEAVWSAKLAHGMLSAFADGASGVSGATLLRGEEAILEVKTHCSALHYCWLLSAAVLAFPAPWRLRIAGVVIGSAILIGSNILRVASLFLLGCHYPGWLSAAHEQFWPAFSLVATVALMGGWALLVNRQMEARK